MVGYVSSIYLSWAAIVLTTLVIGFAFHLGSIRSFLVGFIGIFLLWTGYALFLDLQNNSVMSSRMAQLFQLSAAWQLVLVTGIIGALMGGFSAVTGHTIWQVLVKKKNK